MALERYNQEFSYLRDKDLVTLPGKQLAEVLVQDKGNLKQVDNIKMMNIIWI